MLSCAMAAPLLVRLQCWVSLKFSVGTWYVGLAPALELALVLDLLLMLCQDPMLHQVRMLGWVLKMAQVLCLARPRCWIQWQYYDGYQC